METGRTRILTATASGGNHTSAFWPSASAGGSGSYGYTFNTRVKPTDATIRQIRINVTAGVTFGGSRPGTNVDTQVTTTSEWVDAPAGVFPAGTVTSVTFSHAWNAADSVVFVELTDHTEVQRDITFSGTASTSVSVVWRGWSGGPLQPAASSSASLTPSYASTPGVNMDVVTLYTKGYEFQSFSDAYFQNPSSNIFLAPDIPGSVSLSVSCAGLVYGENSYSISSGGLTMVGSEAGASLTGSANNQFSEGNRADYTAYPQRGAQITCTDIDYETGADMSVAVDRWQFDGSNWVVVDTFDGSLTIPTGEYALAYLANPSSPIGTYLVDTLENINSEYYMTDQDWADGFGYTPMARDPVNESVTGLADRKWRSTKTVHWADWVFEPSHVFDLFADVGNWAPVRTATSGATFLNDNPQYDASADNLSYSLLGGVLTVDVNDTISVLSTKTGGNPDSTHDPLYHLRYYTYRYCRFQVKANQANSRFRLCIGYQDSAPLYAWEFTAGSSWATKELDMALASLYNQQWIGSGNHEVSWADNVRDIEHPQSFYPDGVAVWIEFLDQAVYEFKEFTGYYRPEGVAVENRIPIILQLPVNNWGDSNGSVDILDWEGEMPDGGFINGSYVARLIVNGVVGINFMSNDAATSFYNYWELHKASLDVDTGLTIDLDTANAEWLALPGLGVIESTKPWQEITPGDTIAFDCRRMAFQTASYFGMGDLDGSYGAVVQFRFDKIYNGEICGNAYKNNQSVSDVEITLHDNDTGTIIETATSNADGYYRLFNKYGVKYPVNSTFISPGSTGPTAKEYTIDFSGVTYTTLGKKLNSYWLKGTQLTEPKDGSGYITALTLRRDIPILSHYAHIVDLRAIPRGGATDLLQTYEGWWFRATRVITTVNVERSLDQGATWDTPVELATDAQNDAGSVLGTAPALVTDPWGNLWCWFHNGSGNTQAYRSVDSGASWTSWATHNGLLYPRPARQLQRLLTAAHDGTTLRIYASTDDGATLAQLTSLALTVPRQLVALRVDRRDVIHLVYTDATSVLHRTLQGDDTWSAPATLAAVGSLPAFTVGLERAFLLYWDGGSLAGRRTDETYAADDAAITAPAGLTFGEHYLSVAAGEHLGGADVLLLCGYDAGSSELETRYSANQGATWAEPV